jgi:hypothetical protein
MFSPDIAGGTAPGTLWNWFAARRGVDEAIAALERAGATLLPLIVDTEWQARGVKALNAEIEEVAAEAAATARTLRERRWEVDAVS